MRVQRQFTQKEVLEAYLESDLFILPCRIDENGDRDGLPNVIVEAQSQRLPVISTKSPAFPELIEDGKNGILIDPNDAFALKSAIVSLGENPKKRNEMGQVGEQKVRTEFSHTSTIGIIVGLLNKSLDGKVSG